jgi:hypothetical protein
MEARVVQVSEMTVLVHNCLRTAKLVWLKWDPQMQTDGGQKSSLEFSAQVS